MKASAASLPWKQWSFSESSMLLAIRQVSSQGLRGERKVISGYIRLQHIGNFVCRECISLV
jgi:hypothetical protein